MFSTAIYMYQNAVLCGNVKNLSNDQVLRLSNLKAFPDAKFNMAQMMKPVLV